MTNQSHRLASLDILRGFDLFLLLFLQPILVSISRAYSSPWYDAVMHQLDHEIWQGFRLWDLVMPLFLFMTGAAMPFSFSKYRSQPNARSAIYRRILRRVLLLFVAGMIVQGNLLAFSLDSLKIYNNTLQAIAAGYLIAAVILLNLSPKWQILATALLMIIYSIPMALLGDFNHGSSFAFNVDAIILGNFRGDLTYTWVWSSLNFGATVMFGALAGTLMKNPRNLPRTKIAAILVATGCILSILGLALNHIEPIIKRLWTSSMTIYSAGLCYILMALFYWWIDVLGHSRGLNWLKIYGMNAITAYVIGEVINFRSIVQSISYGLQPLLADFYPAWLTFGNALILFLILRYMHKHQIFLKI